MKEQQKVIVEPSVCPKCGKAFHCSTSSKCWCYEVDISPETMEEIDRAYDSCLCPDCLKGYARTGSGA